MALIVYTILYDQKGFRTDQHIFKVGTNPDGVAFLTSTDSEKWVSNYFSKERYDAGRQSGKKEGEKEQKKVALRRDDQDPFGSGMRQVYIVPVHDEDLQDLSEDQLEFFEVTRPGGVWRFHLTCGASDPDGDDFAPFEEGHAHLTLDTKPKPSDRGLLGGPSLPWPG